MVAFQKGILTAQIFDNRAKFLTGDNARGGPVALSSQEFYIGINDPLGLNPKGIPFTPEIFDLYRPCSAPGSATIMMASARRWRMSASSSGPLRPRMTGVATITSAAW